MRIRSSKRGLTFSFVENDTFRAGTKYRYFLDKDQMEIIIVPDVNGKYKMCRKGINKKPLVDLRNKEIRNSISMCRYMEIEILEQKIIIHLIQKNIETESNDVRELVSYLDDAPVESFEIDKDELLKHPSALQDMLFASGLFSAKERNDIQYIFDVASLFSGAGLLDYPFSQDPSFDIRFACDYDKSAVMTYKKNIGSHILQMDMRELQPDQVPSVDLIIGGPPCVGYSNANRQNISTQAAEEKRLLVSDYTRIVRAKQPLCFLMENVPTFLTKENGKYLEKVLTELSDYKITYQVVKDWDVGGYTVRKRVLLIGSRIGKIQIPNVELTKKRTVRDAFRKITSNWIHYHDCTTPKEETVHKMAQVRPGRNYKDIKEMACLERHSDTYRRLSYDEPAVTIVNWRKVNIMPPEGNRSLSVAEAASLMGLNGSFEFIGNLSAKQQILGNGVTQALACFAKSIIKNALFAYANECFRVA